MSTVWGKYGMPPAGWEVIKGETDTSVLAVAFLNELSKINKPLERALATDWRELSAPDQEDWDWDAIDQLFESLFFNLDRLGPPGYWFGAHPLDARRYGWWPDRIK